MDYRLGNSRLNRTKMFYRVLIIFTFLSLIASCKDSLVELPEVIFSDNTLLDNQTRTNVIKGNYLYQLREDRVLVYEILPNNDKVVVNSFAAVDASEIDLLDQHLGVITTFENNKRVSLYNLSSPSSPTIEQNIEIGSCQNVAVNKGVYYLNQNGECLGSNDTTAGIILVEYKFARKITPFISPASFDIASYKDYLYTASSDAGVIVYDASDSVNLIEVNRISINTKNISIENNWLHAKDEIFIYHLDLNDPANPILTGRTRL